MRDSSATVSVPRSAPRHAAANPGPSSASPVSIAIDGACASASTSATRRPSRASSHASSIAIVVRPGAPAGPHTVEHAASGGRCFGRRCGSDDGRRRLVGIRRHNAEHLRQAALCRIRADGDDPHAEAIAGRHELRGEGLPGRGDGERVGPGQLPEQLGGGAARHRVGGGRSGGRCRDHEPHIDVLPPQPLRQPVADGTVARDDHSHGVVPDDGTTERLEPSATAASAAATSAREITSSTAVPAEPIMLSSRSTDTTVADATRMRGVS